MNLWTKKSSIKRNLGKQFHPKNIKSEKNIGSKMFGSESFVVVQDKDNLVLNHIGSMAGIILLFSVTD